MLKIPLDDLVELLLLSVSAVSQLTILGVIVRINSQRIFSFIVSLWFIPNTLGVLILGLAFICELLLTQCIHTKCTAGQKQKGHVILSARRALLSFCFCLRRSSLQLSPVLSMSVCQFASLSVCQSAMYSSLLYCQC